MAYVPFDEVKARFTIEKVADLLGLALKRSGEQLRGECPSCKSGGPRALVITPGKHAYFCWAEKKGGDLIALVAHIRQTDAKAAANWLVRDSDNSPRNHQSPDRGTVPRTDSELKPLEYLESDHEAVAAVGFDPAFAAAHGIGFAGKGVARGWVLVPFRDETGALLGYVGVQEAWLPKDFKTPDNVVPLKRA